MQTDLEVHSLLTVNTFPYFTFNVSSKIKCHDMILAAKKYYNSLPFNSSSCGDVLTSAHFLHGYDVGIPVLGISLN